MRAVLKKPALLSILCATVETFKKESYLFLLGYKKNENFVIEHAITFQTAKRTFGTVENITYREKLITDLSEFFWKNSQIVGDCHSHTEFRDSKPDVVPSEQDEKSSEQNKVYIIIGIRTKRKNQIWKKVRHGGIIGSIGKFTFEIKAYWAPEDKKLEQIPLICPSAHRLNAFK